MAIKANICADKRLFAHIEASSDLNAATNTGVLTIFSHIRHLGLPALLGLLLCASSLTHAISLELPASGLQPSQIAVVYNQQDPQSRARAEYYRLKRQVPAENMIAVSFYPQQKRMNPGVFAVIKKQVDSKTAPHVQAYALAWTAPYRVGCMSITTAFAFGYDPKFCASGCKTTRSNPYADASTSRPYDRFGIRPAMLLAANTLDDAIQLINRGVNADGAGVRRQGKAYLMITPDQRRNVRKKFFKRIYSEFSPLLPINIVQDSAIKNQFDIMFYFTGMTFIEHIADNHYLPGAMADHLTSAGGQLTGSAQMSALRWLEAGATGSYGSVVEPCNFPQKFPNPYLAMKYYLQGASLIEAYWKSVEMPGQGVFIGEPLAKPYAGYRLIADRGQLLVYAPQLRGKRFTLFRADSADGERYPVSEPFRMTGKADYIRLTKPYSAFYEVRSF